MNIRKLITAALCVVMLLAVLTGCRNSAVSEPDAASASPASSAGTEETTAGPDASVSPDAAEDNAASGDETAPEGEIATSLGANAAKAAAYFEPDEVIMTVNGVDYDWQKFFYLNNYYVNYLEYYNGAFASWDDTVQDGATVKEYVLDSSRDWVLYDAAIRTNAEKLGVSLSEEDKAEIRDNIQETVERYGGEEAFQEQLEKNFCTMELYTDLSETTALANKVFAELYGEHGEKLSDEEVAEYTSLDGYLMAKHILILNSKTDDEGKEVALEGEELAAARAKIDEIKAQLDACPPDQIAAKFDELMAEYSEDPGTEMYPGGYLFQDGNMVQEFEDATKALEIGQYSDVVETDYGFHIIYRLPIDFDAVPSAYSYYVQSGEDQYTLRYITALGQFDSVVASWQDSLDVTYGKAYEQIDFEKMFA